ncbi:ATP/GTP-binding protein [Streptomyces sp. PTM05]|uniref:ATP/GTP-binding protein n=1 Tax=Streptantibioticus parmotrematis TaxID=2873249 RepID=A0ABS7R189_9ACTN|nr:ATP/GTP-binding protein [Streptantibioticus parmotrematis]MBY8889227.1 ATP/GTP-binding protein [Streptantibioticus parmotrematis]
MVDLAKDVAAGEGRGRRYTARAELVLARPDHRPLASLGLSPDPLQRIAGAMGTVRSEAGEEAEVVLDLVPVPDGVVARRRRRLMRGAARRGPSAFGERIGGAGGGGGWLSSLAGTLNGKPAGPRQGAGRVPRQTDLADGVGKFVPGQDVFRVQLLVRVTATHPARAQAHLHQLLAALEMYAGENRWVPVGPRRTGWRPYSNVWWRRASFDRRIGSGEFAPARRQWVTRAEIAGLLKPPTVECAAANVARGGGMVPQAPAGLPTWSGQPDVVPLGLVTDADGRPRMGGVYAKDTLFGAFLGKSGNGKSEIGLVQAIARAYAGRGVWFLDPHNTTIERALPYLTHPAVRDRVQRIDLNTPSMDDMVASWNPLSMAGRRIEHVQEVIGTVVNAVAAAQGWGEGAPRARTILANAVQVLACLSKCMIDAGRPDLQPTVFQIKTLLEDDAWREEVLAHLPDRFLPARSRRFWTASFPKYSGEALTTVTNALNRLETSLSMRAFLGSPTGSYNVRRAMDTGQVVWICPTGGGECDDLITSMLIYDVFVAGLSRRDTSFEDLEEFWVWIDEMRAVDGAGRGYIAKVLEQLRKYQVRMMGLTQMAMRLSDDTRQALLQNQSILSVMACDTDEAKFISARLPHVEPATVANLPKYEYVMRVMLGGEYTQPFRVRGVPVHQVYADYYDPAGLPALEKAIDANLKRRPVAEILAALDSLDNDILTHLTGGASPGGRAPGRRAVEDADVVHDLPSRTLPDNHHDDDDEVA